MAKILEKFKSAEKLYPVLSVFFLFLSLVAGVVLVKQKQDIRDKAYDVALDQYWDWCFWCNGNISGPCGRETSNFYSITRIKKDGENSPPLGGPNFGPPGSCQVGGEATDVYGNYPVKCSSLQKDQFYSGYGAASLYRNNDTNCDDCIDVQYRIDGENLTITATGYSELPATSKLACPSDISDPHGEGCASIIMNSSAVKFKFALSGSTTMTSGDEGITSTCQPDSSTGTTQSWAIMGHDPRAKKIICTATHTFTNIANLNGTNISVVVKNPAVSNDSWPSQANSVCTETITLTTPTPTRIPTPTPTRVSTPTLTPTPTRTPTPTPTNTPTQIPTPEPNACGYTPCDDSSSPCQPGLICVDADNGNSYCSMSQFEDACIINPSYITCCTAPTSTPTNTPTPTPLPELACVDITMDPSGTPSLGDEVNFTCVDTGTNNYGPDRFDFRYNIDAGDYNNIPWVVTSLRFADYAGADHWMADSQSITIDIPGAYSVQCRVCKEGNCTTWGAAQ
ncbi:hypothetical protein KKE47_01410 [Patescibacteria group bacterium]|nr:hypothetical protein [Patescibacteria group bacterium]MBU4390055.1 hypothetical protein [Patescibacteria group bacterium]MBU4431287.1 hypothetical protein [Patescibacteria group bacterium]MBU4578549.1 hypothetical protein [Patescibacteria group bacterium]MCG2702268.1 hypothetical protein [Candidatus Parcubacteria bacterium]